MDTAIITAITTGMVIITVEDKKSPAISCGAFLMRQQDH